MREDELQEVAARFFALFETRAREALHGFDELTTTVVEPAFQTGVASLSTQPVTSNLLIVESVIAVIPNGAGGTLTLGPVIVPLSGPLNVLPGLKLPLPADAPRLLTSTVAGSLSLVLMGHQASLTGRLR